MSTVVFSYGRMNPPHKGHQFLIDKINEVAKKKNAPFYNLVSHSHDVLRNPLDLENKLTYLRYCFRNINFIASSKQYPSIIDHIKYLNGRFDDLYMVCGFDRMAELKELLNKYNGILYKFRKIEVVECGDSNTREIYSGTWIRNIIASPEFKNKINYHLDKYGEIQTVTEIMSIIESKSDHNLILLNDLLIDNQFKYNLILDLHKSINKSQE